jgi:hypothetical protein
MIKQSDDQQLLALEHTMDVVYKKADKATRL